MQQMFIASSFEASERGITGDFARAISKMLPVTVRPWTDIFQDSRSTIENLLEEAHNSHFAVFLFTKDDEVVIRGERSYATRSNVLLEAGLFLSQLSASRVAFIVETGVTIPTDLSGWVYLPLDIRETLAQHHEIEAVAQKLADRWKKHPDLSKLGFHSTLNQARKRVAALENRLIISHDGGGLSGEPIILDSLWCQESYLEALKHVQTRFWTTTFFDSEFWSESMYSSVMDNNRQMLARLRASGSSSIRRIFVLPNSENDFFRAEQARMETFRDRDEPEKVEERIRHITRLRENIAELMSMGCEVRISSDPGDRYWRRLSPEMLRAHTPSNTEVAVFDDFRVDLYRGGSVGVMDRVVSFSKATLDFERYLNSALRYFESLWKSGSDPLAFLDGWEEQIAIAQNRIQYRPNWPIKYDHLSGDDELLKKGEFATAAEAVSRQFHADLPKRYLDVGTCTGRYPVAIAEAKLLAPSAQVYAIDSDGDCIKRAQEKVAIYQARHDNDAEKYDFRLEYEDFILWIQNLPDAERFDLITCMFGTLSHFGVPSRKKPKGYIEDALNLMASRLTAGGLLLIGNWAPHAIRGGKFLDIYTPSDAMLLAHWTPSRDEMEELLRGAGLTTRYTTILNRLDVYASHKAT